MNKFYEETLLKEEFNLTCKLQNDIEFSKYVTILYEDRTTGEERNILQAPIGWTYPEIYVVHYRMPVYFAAGQLRRDWHGVVKITLEEKVLTNKHAHNAPLINFHSNFSPFNNHVTQASICTGIAWEVAKADGIWRFIVSLGELINQEKAVSPDEGHYNSVALAYWNTRGQKPVTNISWPLDLLNRAEKKVVIVSKPVVTKPKANTIDIVPKTSQPVLPKEGKLKITPKTELNHQQADSKFKIVPKTK